MSTKDQIEHRITIDWLLDNLLPYCSYVDAEPEPTILTLPNVHHLATRVEGRLSSPAASVIFFRLLDRCLVSFFSENLLSMVDCLYILLFFDKHRLNVFLIRFLGAFDQLPLF